MSQESLVRWIAGMELWDHEVPAKAARQWMQTAVGRQFLQQKRSQVAFFMSSLARARNSADLEEALQKFIENSKKRAKQQSFWAQHGESIGHFLDSAVQQATTLRADSALQAAVIPLRNASPESLGKATEARDYAIRREALAALQKLHRSQQFWMSNKEHI